MNEQLLTALKLAVTELEHLDPKSPALPIARQAIEEAEKAEGLK